MTITSKDLKNQAKKADATEKTEVNTSENTQTEAETKEVAAEKPKTWVITLVEARSYTHPKSKKKFLKGVPFRTGDKALADDCRANSYFNVLEV